MIRSTGMLGVFVAALIVGLPCLASAEQGAPEVVADDQSGSRAYIKDLGGGLPPRVEAVGVGEDAVSGDAVVVPEPGTIALLGLGLASLGVARRRARRQERQDRQDR